jgi:hypothetical protein
MARPRKQPNPKNALEDAVNAVGIAFRDLQAVFEEHGEDLTPDDHRRAIGFISITLNAVAQKSLLALSTAVLTKGGFTLDLEVPNAPASPHEAAQTLHMPASALAGMPQRGPRVFGEPIPRPVRLPVASGHPGVPNPVTLPELDKGEDDEVGFIDND